MSFFDQVLVSDSYGHIYKVHPASDTVTTVYTDANPTAFVQNLLRSNTNPNNIIATVTASPLEPTRADVLLSQNNGGTWAVSGAAPFSNAGMNNFYSVALSDSGQRIFIPDIAPADAPDANIYHSDNFGSSWTETHHLNARFAGSLWSHLGKVWWNAGNTVDPNGLNRDDEAGGGYLYTATAADNNTILHGSYHHDTIIQIKQAAGNDTIIVINNASTAPSVVTRTLPVSFVIGALVVTPRKFVVTSLNNTFTAYVVWLTEDAGVTWTQTAEEAPRTVDGGINSHRIAQSEVDRNDLWTFISTPTLLNSEDGGYSWRRYEVAGVPEDGTVVFTSIVVAKGVRPVSNVTLIGAT